MIDIRLMDIWGETPIEKVYEAFSAVADARVILDGNTAKVYSSTRDKAYDISFDASQNAIMVNDNASFYVGYLGYPAVAFLMACGAIHYEKSAVDSLKDIPWKQINTKYKNNFTQAVEEVLGQLPDDTRSLVESEAQRIHRALSSQTFVHLGKKVKPPVGMV